jgi:hypothetical protein
VRRPARRRKPSSTLRSRDWRRRSMPSLRTPWLCKRSATHAALDDLVQHLEGTWHRRVSNHPDSRHIRVAWLARRAITQPEDIFNFPPHLNEVQVDDNGGTIGSMGRGAVGIIVQSDSGKAVRLLTTHLKSKLLTSRAVDSNRAMKTNARGSRPTRCTGDRRKPPLCAYRSRRCWRKPAMTGR